MILLPNELHSLITLDIHVNLMNKIANNLTIKPKNLVFGFAEKVLQKTSQTNDYTPDLPILSCIPGDISPDESHFPWHMNQAKSSLNRFAFKVACFKNFEVKVVPYLYIIHSDIQYTGQSYHDILNARIGIEELFGTRKVLEYDMASVVVIPPNILESILTPQQLDEVSKYIPKKQVDLIDDMRYVIPYQFRYFVKLTGQSDNTSLFGDTKLIPDYMSSYNFEINVNLPTKIILNYKGIIKEIKLSYILDGPNQNENNQTTKKKSPFDLIENYSYEIDKDTGSFIIHHILDAEEKSNG